MRENAHLAK